MLTSSTKLQKPLFILLLLLTISLAYAQSAGDYQVITNDEGQHAVWTSKGEIPVGWKPAEFMGNLEECSDYIEKVWTDMRPLSMQKKYKKKMKDGYVVIINHEEQYLIWPRDEYVPDEWELAGAGGSYGDCEEHIEKSWTDKRPLSLRQQLNE